MAAVVPALLPHGHAAQPAVQLHSLIEPFFPDFYGLLGAGVDATSASIESCFRRCSLSEHPDKGGDTERFKKLGIAKDVLCDPQKRRIYDDLIVLVGGGYELMSFIETLGAESDLWEPWQCCRRSIQDSMAYLSETQSLQDARARLQDAQDFMRIAREDARELQDRPPIEFVDVDRSQEGHYVVRNASGDYTTVCLWSQLRRRSRRGRAGGRHYVPNDTPVEITDPLYHIFENDFYMQVCVNLTDLAGFVKAHHVQFVTGQHASEQTRERSRSRSRSPRRGGGAAEA